MKGCLSAVLVACCVGAAGCTSAPPPPAAPPPASAAPAPSAASQPAASDSGLLRPDQIFEILEKSGITYAIDTDPSLVGSGLAAVTDQPIPRSRPIDAYVHVKGEDGPRQVVSERPPAQIAELFGRASEAFEKRDFETARDLYLEASKVAPDYFKTYTFLGNMQHLLGEHGAAEGTLERALELNPQDYQALLFLGDAYFAMGQYHRSKAALLRAFMLNKSSDAVKDRLTTTLAKLDLRLRTNRLVPGFELKRTAEARVEMRFEEKQVERWLPLAACMACWSYEDACSGRSPVEDDPLRLSMYRECLINHAAALAVRREGDSGLSPADRPLLAAIEEGFLEAIIFWEVLSDVAPLVIYLLPDEVQEDIVRYIERFVIVSTRLV